MDKKIIKFVGLKYAGDTKIRMYDEPMEGLLVNDELCCDPVLGVTAFMAKKNENGEWINPRSGDILVTEDDMKNIPKNDTEKDFDFTPDNICEWQLEDDDSNIFATGCDENFYFDHDYDDYLGFKFNYCPFCGKEIFYHKETS